jgi:hypothetical protein
MYVFLVWLTIIISVVALVAAYVRSRDVFHPLVFAMPMFVFIYGYMPLAQVASNDLFSYISEDQALFVQFIVLAVLVAFILGCEHGSRSAVPAALTVVKYDPAILRSGAVVLGGIGFVAWLYMLVAAGGLSAAYGSGYGMLWSDIAYIRDSVYLLLVAIFLLLSRQLYEPRSIVWWLMIFAFSVPWITQAILGARRGPTFVLFVSMGVSWFMARNKRPSLLTTFGAGASIGLLMLFLLANRGSIYVGSEQTLSTDKIGDVAEATAANEYIFGAGCITAARQSGDYFWGKRLLAQVLVRPIPKQLWPNKYADFGVPELLKNAGVAKDGLAVVMGWAEVPGAAAAMVADMWVEFSWGAIPFAGLWGWAYGYCWRRAKVSGGVWITQYVILVVLSVYLITQGLEAVTFRLIILSLPTRWLWRRATLLYPLRSASVATFVHD